MTNIEKIIAEIEKRREDIKAYCLNPNHDKRYDVVPEQLAYILAFIDSLPDENNPEPYNPVYDEDYLNEKIAKATKSWEGVDVNKMLADCRGYEEKPSEDLEEAAEKYSDKYCSDWAYRLEYEDAFIAGAEWMRNNLPERRKK